MDEAWHQFVMAYQRALGELVEGRPEPFKALWSHADDVVIMGAFGGYERGWEQVSARLDWAAQGIASTDRWAEKVVTVVGDDLAYRRSGAHDPARRRWPAAPDTALHAGVPQGEREVEVVSRHADELPRKDEHQR